MAYRKSTIAAFLGVTAIIAGLLSGPARADDDQTDSAPKAAVNFVLETGQKVISVAKQGDDHHIELKQLFQNRFDYKLMGRFAMGRFWKKADLEQKTEYNDLFAAYVPNGYVGRLSEYRDAGFELIKSRKLGGADSIVTTRLTPKEGDAITFDWRVRDQGSRYKVIDLMVGSVSYLKTLRQEFTTVAARSGIEGLLELLRQHAAANAPNAAPNPQSSATPLHDSPVVAEFDLQATIAALMAALRGRGELNAVAMR